MIFRPCIDIHNGKVKQIVGSSLRDSQDESTDNFISELDGTYYSDLYCTLGLKGGHVIILNPAGSKYYDESLRQAKLALCAHPGMLQIGGGINPDNAKAFLDAGASHVIVTSYVFKDGRIDRDKLEILKKTVGKEHLVLDLSCKKKGDDYYIVTDRWQKMTDTKLSIETLDDLSDSCDEFLIHAADVEGKQGGIEENVATLLGNWAKIPVTYAGGVHSISDIKKLREIGRAKVDVTVGSALDIFGGCLSIKDVIDACK
ncbi:1-(5-phosphoribosyl)-5-[(5-phosphoribosylamino)methylideneamino] imidazole-4-carboxamide isomerase [Butyrivibrio fibrisolvens DSM 3071]|uniref:1-(5-phosphoribosyl)-5-[(5-phosphoribosylamino)methylideneamino] imidazole-4-carboxamide isomerase n=1 Tax=Butyrivibrio fibrisolvens DSM 3071 TaxID=1121131 RepID=A0A1M6AVK8_BUTFI|nr:phosphoribosylformimino-5-aminoimidazole carboxamide ribotide isomerase [Butyrivibrio fibrisolvens]SHI40441.1 1-(5-phosphoribosyl)-5-[(5-phosphoribosylamino)methylideneamino] imidazole-4-carboxamide isomerase [Butyrivibrio fibrisolvens DSM 3071]